MEGLGDDVEFEPVARKLAELRRRVASSGGDDRPGGVRIVAVTKGFGPDAVRAARHCGLADIGENYAQELQAKLLAPDVADPSSGLRWHFLGAVQRRKIRPLAGIVDLWQSVDRLDVGAAIARHAPGAAVLVQVNMAGVAERNGCRFEEVSQLVRALRGLELEVRGLMALGAQPDPRPGFRRLAETAQELDLAEVSMGMSADLEVAVEEGATMVRIGTALFGPRPLRRPGSPSPSAGPRQEREDLRRYSHREGGW